MNLKPSDPFTRQLTPNFAYGELCQWQEARRFSHLYQLETAYRLCSYLETVRAHFGGLPITITSGHRPPAINRAIGGAADSEHLYDRPDKGAVDVVMRGVSLINLQRHIAATWPHSVGLGAHRGFVHVGIRPGLQRLRWGY